MTFSTTCVTGTCCCTTWVTTCVTTFSTTCAVGGAAGGEHVAMSGRAADAPIPKMTTRRLIPRFDPIDSNLDTTTSPYAPTHRPDNQAFRATRRHYLLTAHRV